MPIMFEPIDEDEAAAEAARIKTMAEQQSNALRLADLLTRADAAAVQLTNRKEAAAELRRLAAVEEERDKLRELAACAYAGLGAECELPEVWLDALNNAASGEAFSLDGLVPFESVAMRDLAAELSRYREAEALWLKHRTEMIEESNKLRAQLEVSMAATVAAVGKAQWQALTNRELNELSDALRNVREDLSASESLAADLEAKLRAAKGGGAIVLGELEKLHAQREADAAAMRQAVGAMRHTKTLVGSTPEMNSAIETLTMRLEAMP